MKTYSLIEHTADIAIRVKARGLKALFKRAALAMFDIMAEKTAPAAKRKVLKIVKKAGSPADLLVEWLNELLYLSSAKGVIFRQFKVRWMTERSIAAEAFAEDVSAYRVHTEIKAVTYHELSVARKGPLWEAKVVFDV